MNQLKMEQYHQQKLRKTRTRLVSDLIPEPISDVLFEKGAISQDELEVICNHMLTTAEKNRKLLTIISRKGSKEYKAFTDALAPDFPWLLTLLAETPVEGNAAGFAADSSCTERLGSSEDVTNDMINRVVSNLSPHSRWKHLGRALNIPENVFSDIELKFPQDHKAQTYEMLAIWRQELMRRKGSSSPVQVLCDALSDEGMNYTAEKIRSMRPVKVKMEPSARAAETL